MRYIALVFLLLLFGVGAYAFGRLHTQAPLAAGASASEPAFALSAAPISTSSAQASATPVLQKRQIPAGWREYRNPDFHISLLYPDDTPVTEEALSGGTLTVTFQNAKEAKGFQIYVTPYADPQVTEAEFKKDEPSGVRTDVQSVTIDGAVGAAFYGRDANLGDTREVWFIRGGYLYEVTTLKSLDSWILPILQTWKFI